MSNELKGRVKWGFAGLLIIGGIIAVASGDTRGEKIIYGLAYLALCTFGAIVADFYRNAEK